MSKVVSQHRALAWIFGILALITVLIGGYALSRQSNLVIILALTPLFAVLALAFGVSIRRH